MSLVSILDQTSGSLGREAIYWHHPHDHAGGSTPYLAVRAGPWRLIEFYENGHAELYNVAVDIGEENGLAERLSDATSRLKVMLHRWRNQVKAQSPHRNPKYARSTLR